MDIFGDERAWLQDDVLLDLAMRLIERSEVLCLGSVDSVSGVAQAQCNPRDQAWGAARAELVNESETLSCFS